jgi:hypothetical protein
MPRRPSFSAIRPGTVGLDHRRVAVTIDDQPRHSIGFGVDQPAMRTQAKPRSQRQRLIQAGRQPGAVKWRLRVAAEFARGDQTVRIEAKTAEFGAVVAFQPHHAAGGQSAIGRFHVDFVAEGPRVAGFQPPLAPRQQPQQRAVGRKTRAPGDGGGRDFNMRLVHGYWT